MSVPTDFCRVAALRAAEKRGAAGAAGGCGGAQLPRRRLQGQRRGQRRIDAAKALLDAAPPSPYAPITKRMADRMRSLGNWLRNCAASTSRTDRGASEIYAAWADAIDDLLRPTPIA